MSPTDSIFLLTETREHPMHVGGLQLFRPPEGAGPEFAREAYDALVANRDFQPTFRKRPAWVVGGLANVAWAYDDSDDVDIDYHVRRSALPSPGRIRELLELTSRWHSGLLDRHRPLWEAHFVEGLSDGRFAFYSKFHHSLIDGVSALRLMQRSLSTDPDDPELQAIWNLPRREKQSHSSDRSWWQALRQTVGSVAAFGPSTLSLARAALVEQQLTLPFAAPRTMLNVPIGGARRAAAFDMEAACSGFLFVAARTRTSIGVSTLLPRRLTLRSSSTRSNFACVGAGISPISSRSSVPPSASSKQPMRRSAAPVNAPRSCPKISLSIRDSGMAEQLMATNG